MSATATAPTAARTIARRYRRESELATRGNRFHTHAARLLLHDELVALARGRRRFTGRRSIDSALGRSAFRLRPGTAAPTPTTAALRVAGKLQRARLAYRRVMRIRCSRRPRWRQRFRLRSGRLSAARRRVGLWRRRGRWRARIFIIPDHAAKPRTSCRSCHELDGTDRSARVGPGVRRRSVRRPKEVECR